MHSDTTGSKARTEGSEPASVSGRERSVELDFEKAIRELHASPDLKGGIARKVLIRYPDFQVTLRTMKANARIPEHHNPGRICVQTLRGHIRMHVDGKLFDLPSGKALVLDRAVTHDVEALEESAFLLTVALPESVEH